MLKTLCVVWRHSAALPMRRHLQEALVEPLKRDIYKRIDEYAHSVLLFLWHECNLFLDFRFMDPNRHSSSRLQPASLVSSEPLCREDLAEIKDRLEQPGHANISESRRKLFLSLIGDIHYINEMKRLEQDFFSPNPTITSNSSESPQYQKKSAPSDIVPVTGLIVGKLHRLENELKTVVEHWSRRGLH